MRPPGESGTPWNEDADGAAWTVIFPLCWTTSTTTMKVREFSKNILQVHKRGQICDLHQIARSFPSVLACQMMTVVHRQPIPADHLLMCHLLMCQWSLRESTFMEQHRGQWIQILDSVKETNHTHTPLGPSRCHRPDHHCRHLGDDSSSVYK